MNGTRQTVLVTGGTGDLGTALVPRLVAAGYEIVSASRRPPRVPYGPGATWVRLDLNSGEGLAEAMRGVDVVVHTASSPFRPEQTDMEGTKRLLAQAKAAGVGHAIFVSIVGIERVPYAYYRTKVAVEELFERSGVPYSILRASQFLSLFERVMEPQLRLPLPAVFFPTDFQFQPVDVEAVADRLVRLVREGPGGRLPDFAGPEVMRTGEILRAVLRARGIRRPLVHLPLAGKVPAAFRAGAVTDPSAASDSTTLYDQLERKYGRSGRQVGMGGDGQGRDGSGPGPFWARLVAGVIGVSYVLAGAALLLTPEWFFLNVGHFPPFNRHYAGDAGAFNLPLGLALLWAARNLYAHRPLVWIATIASVLHALNHGYDHLLEGATLSHWLSDAGPLALAAVLLVAILWVTRQSPSPSARVRAASRREVTAARRESGHAKKPAPVLTPS